MALADDGELVRRALRGDDKAFEWLVLKYSRYAGAVALGVLGDEHDAADVVQESFIKVMRKLSALQDPQSFKPWLRNIVRSTALDRLRRRKPWLRLDGADSDDGEGARIEPLSTELDPQQALKSAEFQAQIRERVHALPASQREVVVLKYLQGLSYEEIAEAVGASVSSVESRLHRARASLREALQFLAGEASGA